MALSLVSANTGARGNVTPAAIPVLDARAVSAVCAMATELPTRSAETAKVEVVFLRVMSVNLSGTCLCPRGKQPVGRGESLPTGPTSNEVERINRRCVFDARITL